MKNGYRPSFKKPIPSSYRNLIESCWSAQPNNRPTFNLITIQLKSDRGFITDSVDEEKFFNFVQYIGHYDNTFESSRPTIQITKLLNLKVKEIEYKDLSHIKFYRISDFYEYIGSNKAYFNDNFGGNIIFNFISNIKSLIKGRKPFYRDSKLGFSIL